MKTLMTTALATTLLLIAVPALAGRDETQIRQTDKVVAAKRAAQIDVARQKTQTSLAGAIGQSGKIGPTTDEPKNDRPARRSLADHP